MEICCTFDFIQLTAAELIAHLGILYGDGQGNVTPPIPELKDEESYTIDPPPFPNPIAASMRQPGYVCRPRQSEYG